MYSETINIKQFNLFESLIKGWRSSPEYFVDYVSLERIHQHGKELRQVEKYASYADTWDAAIREGKFNQLWVVSAGFGEGLLGGDFLVEPDEWVKKVLTKMAGAFGLAYQRFADLQKAEAQAREAQIETALERIRSKTMGMQKSEDLADISLELVKQVQELGKKVWFCAFNIYDDDPQGSLEWGSNGQGTFPKYRTPREGVFLHYYKAGQQGESLLINEIGQEECPSHYDYLCSLPGVGEQLLEMKANGIPFPKSQIDHVAFFKFGYVLFITYDPAPEAHDIFKRFAKVFEQSYTRFLDLQKAEAQAREAQIEAALEKVRAQAMAMHNSEDMGQCILKMFSELTALGVDKGTRFGIGILNDENENNQLWTAIKEGEEINMHIGNLDMSWHPLLQSARKAWKSQVPLHKYVLEGEDLLNYYKMINEAPDYKLQVAIDKLPEREIHYGFIFKHGFFYAFCPNEFQPELIHITQRFSSLFSQTYTRFLDLKKAEAQAREAQIEASLERVRSRSLAMHKSEELEEVILVVSEQLQQLQFKFHNVSFGFDNEQMGLNFWLASPGLPKPFLIKVPYIDNPAINRPIEARNNGIDFNADILSREENIQFLQHMFDHSDLSHLPVKTKNFLMSTTGIARSQCLMKNTILTIANYALSPYSEEQNAILRRFGNVFEQAYVRFLDLKKAEAQAKEAQVALSLERIRAQVTAMQESSDLFDIVVSMRKEFLSMGHEADYFWHMQWLPDAYDMSMTSDDGSRVGMVISIPKFVHEAIPDLDKWEKGDESICVLPLNADAAWDYIENMNTHGRYELADPNAPSQEDIQHIGGLTFIIARTTHGEIGYSLAGEVPNPPKDALNTLERFAGVFDLAYKRFEDLKASEHQHRETQIELSLERIRAQAMAMKVSTDLLDIVVKMRTEFITLGHEAQYFWYMRWFPQKYEKAMTSGDGTKVGMVMELPRHMHGDIKLLADWEKSQEATVVYAMDPDMAVDYVDKMVALGDFKQVDPNAPSADDIRHIGGLTFIMTKTTFGEIGYSLPGVVPNPPADDLNTLKRFASAFDLAYGRFEDLQKAEAQAIRAKKDLEAIKIARKKAEDALTELKSTQSQLIQSEKMASLGELTAGIAHEIQNPLNFVNNFSEVSNEMIKELQEERAKAKNEQDESLIDEILIDIEQNLSKINHHGNRAGDIVKGMLQHSRAGSGTKELTDINLLADEYLRLAYHGLRAKDKSFNATMKTEFDESIGNINIIPQDIGRVILNLITNAFYAVNEKNKQSIAGYEPTVTVTTSKGGEGIRGINNIIKITVKDNGNGIPQKILDKIFQPFFTTKPTGQGTGLGLSLSYDIVKAHGGELKVETKEGEGLPAGASAQAGSEFRILLPIV